jgi:hypothetical protein
MFECFNHEISQELVKKVGDSSVFLIIWDRVNISGNILVHQLKDMMGELDSFLGFEGSLHEHRLVVQRLNSIIANKHILNPLNKLETFDLLIEVLNDITFADIERGGQMSLSNDNFLRYIADETLGKPNTPIASIFGGLDSLMEQSKSFVNDSEFCLTDSEDDEDDIDKISLMGLSHKRSLSSPSTIHESCFHDDIEKFSIKHLIDYLQQLHNNVNMKFNTIDMNLRRLKLQNSKDRDNLLDLSIKNDQMLQKIDLIKIETKSLFIRLNLYKLNQSDLQNVSDSLMKTTRDLNTMPLTSCDESSDSLLLDKQIHNKALNGSNKYFEISLLSENLTTKTVPSKISGIIKGNIEYDPQCSIALDSNSLEHINLKKLETINSTLEEVIESELEAENQFSELEPSRAKEPDLNFSFGYFYTLILIILSYVASYFFSSGS